jgi:vacuolar-type H+-ATPase subunit H
MDCDYCKKTLSTKSNLSYHQKNNKVCLTIQQKENENGIEIELVNCEFCNKSFSESNLIKHLKKCKIKIDKETENFKKEKNVEIKKLKEQHAFEIEKFKKEINELNFEIVSLKAENNIFSKGHQEMIKLAKQPKNNNNNITIGNFFNDTEKVKDIINAKLDRFDIAAGQKGIAQFAAKNILKNDDGLLNYVCTDQSRGVFNLLTESGKCEKDIKAKKLTNLLFESGLKTKTHDIGKSLWTKEDGSHDGEKFRMYQEPIYEINTMSSDNSTFRNELACLTTT